MLTLALAQSVLPISLAYTASEEPLSENEVRALQSAMTGARVVSRCGFLSDADRKELIWHLKSIAEFVETMPNRAEYSKLVSQTRGNGDHIPCNSVGRAVAKTALYSSRRLNFELSGTLYLERRRHPVSDLFRLYEIAIAVGIEERCNFRDEAGRHHFMALYQAISKKIADEGKHPEQLLSSLDNRRKGALGDANLTCSPPMRDVATDAYIEAQVLSQQIGVQPESSPESGR